MQFFLSQITQNNEKHKHIEHMGYILCSGTGSWWLFLMRYVEITLLDA